MVNIYIFILSFFLFWIWTLNRNTHLTLTVVEIDWKINGKFCCDMKKKTNENSMKRKCNDQIKKQFSIFVQVTTHFHSTWYCSQLLSICRCLFSQIRITFIIRKWNKEKRNSSATEATEEKCQEKNKTASRKSKSEKWNAKIRLSATFVDDAPWHTQTHTLDINKNFEMRSIANVRSSTAKKIQLNGSETSRDRKYFQNIDFNWIRNSEWHDDDRSEWKKNTTNV